MGTVTAFLPNEKVFSIIMKPVEHTFPCLACSNGKIKLVGKKYDCPCCDGRGIHVIHAGYNYTPTGELTVSTTSIYLVNNGAPPMIDYVFTEPFFGGRSIRERSAVFATLEEAQRWCDEQNANIPEEPFTRGDCYGNN